MNILVVDDNPIIIENLTALLSAQGYFVTSACHGLDASEALLNNSFDLVVVDHLMPIMNGIQLTKHIRQHELFADIPVIFMTTQGIKSVEYLCDTLMFSAIIDKPIDQLNFINLVNDLLLPNTRRQSL
jgi:CheY-like chemotaxis protein